MVNKEIIVRKSVIINTTTDEAWNALVNPEIIKQYLFGTEVISDWKKGSTIIYRGVWNGRKYEDKGKILKIIPKKLLETSFWSSLSGLPDIPKNYKKITYELKPEKGRVKLILTQDNNADEEEKNHSEENWGFVLNKLKEILEGRQY